MSYRRKRGGYKRGGKHHSSRRRTKHLKTYFLPRGGYRM